MTELEREAAEIRKRLHFGCMPDVSPSPAVLWEEHQYTGPHKTVVVLGMEQGGTSAMAAMVCRLGVDFGTVTGNTFEENEIKLAIRHEKGDLASVISDHNRNADVWGFKFPTVFEHRTPKELHGMLRNPYYVLILRDLAAIMQTHMHMVGTIRPHADLDILACLREKLETQHFLIARVAKLPAAPKLLVSFQRLLQNPERLCEQLATFLGLVPTRKQQLHALASVSPQSGYLLSPPPSTVAGAKLWQL